MRDLRWKLRVLSWRLAALLPLILIASACDYRERHRRIEETRRQCIAEITTAPTVEAAEAIADRCHLRLEGYRR